MYKIKQRNDVMNEMFRKIALVVVTAMTGLALSAATNSMATAYCAISTYRCGPVPSLETSLFTSPAGLALTIR